MGKGFFLFEFAEKEDKELIFRNGPYFMGPPGLYLNKWTPDFDPSVDVPSAIPVWVRLPNLPMHCWNWESLKHIGNTLGKSIDRANCRDQFDCARICVEVDLEVSLPEAIKIRVGSWSHVQKLMSSFCSSAGSAMSMAILLGTVQKTVKQRRARGKDGRRSKEPKTKPQEPETTMPKLPRQALGFKLLTWKNKAINSSS